MLLQGGVDAVAIQRELEMRDKNAGSDFRSGVGMLASSEGNNEEHNCEFTT